MAKILKTLSATQICERLGGELRGAQKNLVSEVVPLHIAQSGNAAFIAQPVYRRHLQNCQASLLICSLDDYHFCHERQYMMSASFIVTHNPYAYFAKLANWFEELHHPPKNWGMRAMSAGIDQRARLASTVITGPNVVIEEGAEIADHVEIGANCVLGARVKVGARSRLYPNVTIYADCEIGEDCIIHSGAVIGADGFGFAPDAGSWIKIPQTGRVLIGNQVEIGAQTCIDRGAMSDTLIGDGVKLDNLIQIAHNVEIGANTVIAANTGVAGSTKIGKGCQIGGAANIVGHIEIADGTVITATTMVSHSIRRADRYTGIVPFDLHAEWERNAPVFRQLRNLRERLRAIEKNLKDRFSTN